MLAENDVVARVVRDQQWNKRKDFVRALAELRDLNTKCQLANPQTDEEEEACASQIDGNVPIDVEIG